MGICKVVQLPKISLDSTGTMFWVSVLTQVKPACSYGMV